MKSLKEYSPSEPPRFVLTDIDDTLTEDGKLGAEAYAALWRLHNAGIKVIPVTGRPAGWCDMIIRQWPVAAVVGENGAFVYYFKDNQLKSFIHPDVADGESIQKLEEVFQAVKKEIPGVRKARDQFARVYDLAIDFNEDPPRLGYDAAVRIKEISEACGAEAKISSIHVNIWFGNYSKRDAAVLFMKERWGISEDDFKAQAVFCGDSPNDEPMFAFLPVSFAVANILDFKEILETMPAYVADSRGGAGFVEISEKILKI